MPRAQNQTINGNIAFLAHLSNVPAAPSCCWHGGGPRVTTPSSILRDCQTLFTTVPTQAFMRTHIFVTGQPGVGKTTLIRSVLEQLQLPAGLATGFYTEEVRSSGERVGFDVVTLDGSRAVLSRIGTAQRGAPAVGKYVVDVPSFEGMALPAMQVDPNTTQLVVIDEVGKMELFSTGFLPAVLAALDNPRVAVLGSVPVPLYGRTIPQVEVLKQRPDVEVITVRKDNRDSLVVEICSRMQQTLLQMRQ